MTLTHVLTAFAVLGAIYALGLLLCRLDGWSAGRARIKRRLKDIENKDAPK